MSSSGATAEKEYFVAVGFSDVVTGAEAALQGIVDFKMYQHSSRTQEYKLSFQPLPHVVWNCGKVTLSVPKQLPKWLIDRLGTTGLRDIHGTGWTRIVSNSEGCSSQEAVTQHELAFESVVAKFNRQNVFGKERDHAKFEKQLGDLIGPSSMTVSETSMTSVEDPSWNEDWPEIPPHPLQKRRSRVRDLWRKGYARKKIAGSVGESEHVVKKDLEWMRARSLMPGSRP